MLVGRNFKKGISTMRVPIKSLLNDEMEKPKNARGESHEMEEEERTPKKDRRRTFMMDTSRLRDVPGSKDKMWDSKDGKVTNIRLPCRYHKHLGMTPEECLNHHPRHCFECSRPGKIAPAVHECTGRHQYRLPTPRKRTPPSSNNGDKKEEAIELKRETTEHERDGYTGTKDATEEYTTQRKKTTPPRDKGREKYEDEEAEMNSPAHLQTEAEPKDGIVAAQNTAKTEKPRVEPNPDSKDIGEMFAQAAMEHIDHLRQFEERAKKAKAATELGRAKKLEEEQVKLKEERSQEDLDRMAKKLEEEQVELREEKAFPFEDIDRLEIIRARRHKIAKLKERNAELAADAMAAIILEEFEKRNAELLETKAAAEVEGAKKLAEEPKKQEKAEEGASDKPDSM